MPIGSSPLARGLLDGGRDSALSGGIIPARAGFTRRRTSREPTGQDHPRSRGVYSVLLLSVSSPIGSSPLARGLRTGSSDSGEKTRIIPARAGFTFAPVMTDPSLSDHPRSRGVYLFAVAIAAFEFGSSPLARGLHDPAPCRHDLGRIIPARAGFTRGRCLRCGQSPDHPRSRGVYIRATYQGVQDQGSSPLARGLQVNFTVRINKDGIIPARAGFTLCRRSCCPSGSDHPRSRGVYRIADSNLAMAKGSSPLARGLLTL